MQGLVILPLDRGDIINNFPIDSEDDGFIGQESVGSIAINMGHFEQPRFFQGVATRHSAARGQHLDPGACRSRWTIQIYPAIQHGAKPVAGIDLSKPRMRMILNAVIALAASPQGITVSALAAKVRELSGQTPEEYKTRHAAYDLKKLRSKHWAQPVGKSRRYLATTEGFWSITALLVLRQGVLKPLLAGATFSDGPSYTGRSTLLGDLYQTLQADLLRLFQALGVSVHSI